MLRFTLGFTEVSCDPAVASGKWTFKTPKPPSVSQESDQLIQVGVVSYTAAGRDVFTRVPSDQQRGPFRVLGVGFTVFSASH